MNTFTLDHVALQLYTLRDHCKTLSDLETTLTKVREIGYRAVQISGVAVPYPETKKALAKAGLIACATHENGDLILDDPEAVVARLAEIGVKHTAYPYPNGIDFADAEAVRNLARRLDQAGAVLAKSGCTLSYHNHAIEFLRFENATVLDFIYQATNPANLKAELDTYWVVVGGAEPTAWIEKMAGRQPLLHLKDALFTPENKLAFAEIGWGNLDWSRILKAAAQGGVEWLIVEQDSCAGDAFVSIRRSFDFLKAMLA